MMMFNVISVSDADRATEKGQSYTSVGSMLLIIFLPSIYHTEDLEERISKLEAFIYSPHLPQAPTPQQQHCLLYTSPSPRDATLSRMPSSA